MDTWLTETCREVEINLQRSSVYLAGWIWKSFLLLCISVLQHLVHSRYVQIRTLNHNIQPPTFVSLWSTFVAYYCVCVSFIQQASFLQIVSPKFFIKIHCVFPSGCLTKIFYKNPLCLSFRVSHQNFL